MPEYINAGNIAAATDSERINGAIAKAKETGINRVIIPKQNIAENRELWLIDQPISLPSDIEIFLDGAHLVLADNTFINMFATENYLRGEKYEQKNIVIHGTDGATLDGGNYNGLSERNSKKDGRPHIRVNTMMMIYNTDGLSVHDLRMINQRWWAVTNMFVSHAEYRNIDFKADYSRIDADGVHHPDELPQSYEEIYIKNADGIDLRLGCHDFVIENITGFTEDDTVALTAITGFVGEFLVDGKATDICNVQIKNVCSDCGPCANVRLLTKDGNKLHDITVDGVTDARTCTAYRAGATVRIGDPNYGKAADSAGDTYNITVRNVDSKANSAVLVCGPIKNSVIEGIKGSSTTQLFAVREHALFDNVRVAF